VPGSGSFLADFRREARSRVTQDDVSRGQALWTNDYFSRFQVSTTVQQRETPGGETRQVEQPQPTESELQMMNRISSLGPLAAVAFLRYSQAVSDNNIGSEQERRLVVRTVARLAAISPRTSRATSRLLIVDYISAISNLAEICYDNPDAFREALTTISARVEAETDVVVSSVTPTSLMPLRIRTMVDRLDRAFGDIRELSRRSLSSFDRLNLWDDTIRMRTYQPHPLMHGPVSYVPRLRLEPGLDKLQLSPYPLPNHLHTYGRRPLFSLGGIGSSPSTYGGTIDFPDFSTLDVSTQASAVGTAIDRFLDERHQVVQLGRDIPGISIQSLSRTRLISEINRAFVPAERPEYSSDITGGGGAIGASDGERSEGGIRAAGLGSLMTPTGGVAIGGSATPARTEGSEEQSWRVAAGAAAVGVPIGFVRHIPIVGGGAEVTGIDSMIGGYQRLTNDEERIIARAITRQWSEPGNSRQTLIILNRDEDVRLVGSGQEPRELSYTTAKYVVVDRNGTIYDARGGENDFIDGLNFLAGFANSPLSTPTTSALNAEPTISRGGGAVAVDLGRVPLLMHFQAVPFLRPSAQATGTEPAPQPLLIQWTVGGGGTVTEEGGAEQVHEVTAPGSLLRLKGVQIGAKEFNQAGAPPAQGDEPLPVTLIGHNPPGAREEFWVQDIRYMLRRVTGRRRAWELRLGAGYGEARGRSIGRGGAFFRFQQPTFRIGGGAYYEGGATDLEALAMFDQAEQERRYIEALHRIGLHVYSSGRVANQLLMGALGHAVLQLREDQQGGRSYDDTFYRFVGLIRGLRNSGTDFRWGARVTAMRRSTLDQMLEDYQQLQADMGRDPRRAAEFSETFRQRYAPDVRRILDHYSLGIQIGRDFSLQATLVAREDEEGWTSQVPQTLQGRALYTWGSGFVRAFSAMPLLAPYGSAEQNVGILGMGLGSDIGNGRWFQRIAADAGLLWAREESEDSSWQRTGVFTQTALRLYSNVLDDSREYRRLNASYRDYREAIRAGNLSRLPQDVRDAMAERMPASLAAELGAPLRAGTDTRIRDPQAAVLEDLLWSSWYSERMDTLQHRFNGHMRLFLPVGSLYLFNDRTYWDLAAFMEHVDGFKSYLIVSGREDIGAFAGAELRRGRWRAGLAAGAGERGFSAAASLGVDFTLKDMPADLTLTGYGSTATIPSYAAPMYPAIERNGVPWGGILRLRVGGGSGAPAIPQQRDIPYRPR
jgi:hypothetical protein